MSESARRTMISVPCRSGPVLLRVDYHAQTLVELEIESAIQQLHCFTRRDGLDRLRAHDPFAAIQQRLVKSTKLTGPHPLPPGRQSAHASAEPDQNRWGET